MSDIEWTVIPGREDYTLVVKVEDGEVHIYIGSEQDERIEMVAVEALDLAIQLIVAYDRASKQAEP